jgi:hypothetical protein
MPRYPRAASAEPVEWTPERILREVRAEDDELSPADVAAREWSFDPAFPLCQIGAGGRDAPWPADDAIEWLRTEAVDRTAYGGDPAYYDKMYDWWQGQNAHDHPLVIFEHPSIPGLFSISGGHHRFACAAKRGWGTIPAIVGYLKRSES